MNKNGLSTILVVILVSSVSLLLAVTASFLALGDLEIANDYIKEKESLYVGDACLEDILLRIKADNSLLLSDYSLLLNEGLCIINIENEGFLKNINIEANKDNYYKNIEASFNLGDYDMIVSY